ncbi:MAG: methyltransferase domain-containing protein [Kiritimatiellae bacterium]|nr:methyltransferase domain-containing protein [Kiritimatiellia bacterium]
MLKHFFILCAARACQIFPFLRRFNPDAFSRTRIAARYLAGDGIEIGALHNPLCLPRGARAKYVDRMSLAELRRQYPEFKKKRLAAPDIIDNGETLASVANGSLDFVVASHFLEHCENPILALQNMIRVLRPNGVIYLVVPEKRATFDKDRPTTGFAHVERDYREGPAWSRRTAFEEYVRLVEKITDPEKAAERVNIYLQTSYSIHYHAWTEWEIMEMILFLKRRLNMDACLELICNRRSEVIIILRKQ